MPGTRCCVGLGVALALMTTALLGLEVAYNVYAVAIKQTFNFTQTQVECISVSGLVGMGASLAEPFITGRFGYRIGYTVIWFTTTGSTLLMWLSVVYKDVFKYWPSIVCLFQFLMSLGQNAGSTRLTSISIHNLPKRYTGVLVGLAHAAIASAKLIYGGIFEWFFPHSLGNFFLCVAAMFAVSFAICSIVHIPQDLSKATTGPDQPLLESQSKKSAEDKLTSEDISFLEMVKSVYFHLVFWPSVIIYSIMFTYMNNITSMAYSLGLEEPMHVVYVLSGTVVIGRIFFGVVFDKFKSPLCGFLLVLVGSTCFLVGILLFILSSGEHTYILHIVTFLLGVGVSVGITVPSMLLVLRFGADTFPYIIGCLYCFTAFFCLLFQYIVGIIYDGKVVSDGFCYGRGCFQLSSIVFASITAAFLCLNIFNSVGEILLCRK